MHINKSQICWDLNTGTFSLQAPCVRRPYHPQKPGSQTLGLQCAPPTPPIGKSKESVPNEYSNLRRKINKMLQVCMIKDVWKDINLIGRG